jgi:hypothetical protein
VIGQRDRALTGLDVIRAHDAARVARELDGRPRARRDPDTNTGDGLTIFVDDLELDPPLFLLLLLLACRCASWARGRR